MIYYKTICFGLAPFIRRGGYEKKSNKNFIKSEIWKTNTFYDHTGVWMHRCSLTGETTFCVCVCVKCIYSTGKTNSSCLSGSIKRIPDTSTLLGKEPCLTRRRKWKDYNGYKTFTHFCSNARIFQYKNNVPKIKIKTFSTTYVILNLYILKNKQTKKTY